MEREINKQAYYFNKLIRVIKEILDDPELTPEEKIRLLAIIL
jgi:hypothetical protein